VLLLPKIAPAEKRTLPAKANNRLKSELYLPKPTNRLKSEFYLTNLPSLLNLYKSFARPKCTSQRQRQRNAKVPLVKSPSKAAFRKNIKAEVNAGKPVKQAVAIAYSVKRESAKKGKK
jgi:hypothetical protein